MSFSLNQSDGMWFTLSQSYSLTEKQFGEVGGLYVVVVDHWGGARDEADERRHEEVEVVGIHHPGARRKHELTRRL